MSKGVRIYCVKRQLRSDNLKELDELQALLPKQIIKTFWHVQDDERQRRVLNFVMIRAVLRL